MQQSPRLDYFDVLVSDDLSRIDTARQTGALRSISASLARNVDRIVVDTSLHMPSMFEIHILDQVEKGQYRWIDGDELRVGTAVVIRAAPVTPESKQAHTRQRTLICGEITSVDCDFGSDGQARLIVRGYDISHRLHLGQKSATFANMSDSDIARKLAREAKITLDARATEGRLDHVFQHNQTDMQFLRTRAAGLGYGLWVDEDGRMHFQPINHSPKHDVTLEWGKQLSSFQPRLNARRQVRRVEAFSWNAKTKSAVHASVNVSDDATRGVRHLNKQRDKARAMSALTSREVVADRRLTHEQAKAAAQARAEEIAFELIEAEGECVGDPSVRAGSGVKIEGVGRRFTGEYAVTSATHVYSHTNGYVTRFSISGCTPNTITHTLTDALPSLSAAAQRAGGVVVGTVTNVNDPDNLSRVKVKLPWLGQDPAIESTWCRIATLMAGKERGALFLPEVDDEVLVAFEHGDVNAPFVIGALWNGVDKPPAGQAGQVVSEGKINQRLFHSRSGHRLVFDDTEGAEKVIVHDKDNNGIVIDASKSLIRIDVDGNCEINASKQVSIDCPSGDVAIRCGTFSVEAARTCSIESNGTLSLKAGATLSAEAAASVSVDGKPIQLNKQSLVVLP